LKFIDQSLLGLAWWQDGDWVVRIPSLHKQEAQINRSESVGPFLRKQTTDRVTL